MSKTTIDIAEVQHVVHAAIAYWGWNVADSTLPEGSSGASFDPFEEVTKILRACTVANGLGEQLSPPDFEAMNLREPQLFDALRDIVAKWTTWCAAHVDEFEDPSDEFVTYWAREKVAADRVLELIDGEALA